MIGWIIFLVFMELYSIGMCIFLKRQDRKGWLFCLVPFVVFFYVQKLSGIFKILIFPVKKWGKTVLIAAVVTLLAYLFGVWSMQNQNPDYVQYLLEILWLVAGTCIGIVWLGIAASTEALLRRYHPFSRVLKPICYLLFPLPFLLAFQKVQHAETIPE